MNDISSQNKSNNLGIFDGHSDIGKPQHPGIVTYNAASQEYTIEGSGASISGENDEFHFVWKKMQGDFILNAAVELADTASETNPRIGWMARQSMDTNSPHVSTMMHGSGLSALQYKPSMGGMPEEKRFTTQSPNIIQLERKGNKFITSVAKWGETFVSQEISDTAMSNDIYVGLFVCADNPKQVGKAIFRNVRVTVPVNPNYIPYTDYIGSYLEVMEVESGLRKIIYQAPYSLQAPNWTPDGKTLIYNCKGLLYNFDLATLIPSVLNTDFANDNNNDHVLTFDGKTMGISHHSVDDEGKSTIYYLPITGGKPVRVTPKGPSYLHGWSPDGKQLVYTGGRNGIFNIYKISKDGGEETRLTTVNALDDGPEYTPDGKYIYFNSTRTGKMKIWRMKPDGSEQEQVTFDEYNDWFPHFSPDGKWIVIISYLPDINPVEHPFYKHVYLRLMPITGGQPKVIAYLYGGQGSINVPSWSPDGKRIAFVSNSDFK